MIAKEAKLNKSRKRLIFGAAAAGVILFFSIGTMVALSTSSGVEKFSGVEKRVAEHSVEVAWMRASGIDYGNILGTLKITAEDVQVNQTGNTRCGGDFIDRSPDGADNYLVTVGYRTFFGILFDTDTLYICRSR